MRSVDPRTGQVIREYPEHTEAEVEERVARAARTFESDWSRRGIGARGHLVRRLAALLRERKDELCRVMALEMGKPVAEGALEVEKCAVTCDHYAEHGERLLADEGLETEAKRSAVVFRPLGAVLAIMPWNYPLWQVIRFAAPALMAGNVALLKHAHGVTGCALELERLFRDAGCPDGAFSVLVVEQERALALLDDPRVAAATLTGSTRAGRAVASRAGQALKKCVLELGGSDPYVVLADADLELAATTCVKARLVNAGQSCIAAKRFVVVEAVREAFEAHVLAHVRAVKVGDPLQAATQMGPLARVDLRDEVHRQVTESVRQGARLLLGGEVPGGEGAWYPPTLLAGVKPGMSAFDEEVFGPVAAVVPARDEADALRLANLTAYGLGAAVFTRDLERGERIAREELRAGSCFVNAQVRSDPRLPFGGVGDSGFGRELGVFGIREFVNVKTLWVAAS